MIPQAMLLLLGAFTTWIITTTFGVLFVFLIIRVLLAVDTGEDKDKLYETTGMGVSVALIATNVKDAAVEVATAAGNLWDYLSEQPLITAFKVVLILALIVLALFVMRNSNRIFSQSHHFYECTVYPKANGVFLYVNNALRMVWDFSAGSVISTARLLALYKEGWIGVIVTCGGDTLRVSLNKLDTLLRVVAVSYYDWQTHPGDRVDVITPAVALGEFASSFYPILNCLCHRLDPVWRVITGVFSFDSFHMFADYLINSIVAIWRMIRIVFINAFGLDADEDAETEDEEGGEEGAENHSGNAESETLNDVRFESKLKERSGNKTDDFYRKYKKKLGSVDWNGVMRNVSKALNAAGTKYEHVFGRKKENNDYWKPNQKHSDSGSHHSLTPSFVYNRVYEVKKTTHTHTHTIHTIHTHLHRLFLFFFFFFSSSLSLSLLFIYL
jgi:hypothetical protein